MNKAVIEIGGKQYTLCANVFTWLEYKRLFKRDWQADRLSQLADLKRAQEFAKEFGGIDDAAFDALPPEKKEAYYQGLRTSGVDIEFALNTLYAMAVAGGFNGTRKDMFENISPSALDPRSEFMRVFAELSKEFVPEINTKKNS